MSLGISSPAPNTTSGLQLRAARLELERREVLEWRPRDYQQPLWDALHDGCKRAVAVWHRRAGKDAVSAHWACGAAQRRVGNYWHMLPTQTQARKVMWDAINPHSGIRIIDEVFPAKICKARNTTEMKIELKSGSIWQLVGSDNFDSLVGTPPVGIVFSEWSLANPMAWDYMRPILAENGGWALFIYTPRGRNHGQAMYDISQKNPGWFGQILTVEDTGAISVEAIEEERSDGMSDEMINQEFFCSFDAPMHGAYYGKQMNDAEDDGRLGTVPHDQAARVETWWDLGIGDSTAIWFAQRIGLEIHLIDYYEASGEALAHYAHMLQQRATECEYVYGDHIVPHDVKARELGTGKTRQEVLEGLGIKVTVAPDLHVSDGIETVRNTLNRCWFDREKCQRGIDAMRGYRKQWDEVREAFRDKPYHDWASHAADAFRYGAVTEVSSFGTSQKIKYPSLGVV